MKSVNFLNGMNHECRILKKLYKCKTSKTGARTKQNVFSQHMEQCTPVPLLTWTLEVGTGVERKSAKGIEYTEEQSVPKYSTIWTRILVYPSTSMSC